MTENRSAIAKELSGNGDQEEHQYTDAFRSASAELIAIVSKHKY